MNKKLQEKILNIFLGIIIGILIVYGYNYFMHSSSAQNQTMKGNFDPSNMSDTQLEKMATRAGITKEELKKRLDAGENIRDIMPSGSRRNSTGTTNSSSGTAY